MIDAIVICEALPKSSHHDSQSSLASSLARKSATACFNFPPRECEED